MTDVTPPVRWLTAFIDRPTERFDETVAFWTAVTGSSLSSRRGHTGEFATLVPPDGDAYLRVQRIDDGPGGCHIDLHVDDVEVAARRAELLGAEAHHAEDGLVVLRSPAGLWFCAVHHDGESARPGVPNVDGRSRTRVDQVCIDVPPDEYDRECRFWAAVTCWEHRAALLPEFSYTVRPDPIAIRLLFQRRDAAPSRDVARAHLDLACDDVATAVADHTALGARVVAVHEHWTVMADPSGLPYCLTVREPDSGVRRATPEGVGRDHPAGQQSDPLNVPTSRPEEQS